jgi:hypothetical protein
MPIQSHLTLGPVRPDCRVAVEDLPCVEEALRAAGYLQEGQVEQQS